MNSYTRSVRSLLAFGLLVGVSGGHVLGEDETAWLILNTHPEPTPIELVGSLKINADGDMEATPVDPEICSGSPGDNGNDNGGETCEDVIVDPSNFLGEGLSQVTVLEGANVTFTWDSRGAYYCDGTGELSEWDDKVEMPPRSASLAASQRRISTSGLAREEPYEVGLECYNGPVSVEETVFITVQESTTDLPERCNSSERQAPPGWTQLTTGALSCSYSLQGSPQPGDDCREIEGVWPLPFMELQGSTRRLGLRSSDGEDYIAMAFTTEGLTASNSGRIGIETFTSLQSARKFVTISECPGDFNHDAIMDETGCSAARFTQNLNWGGNDTCQLEADKTYYLNILYTQSPLTDDPSTIEPNPSCVDGDERCGNIFSIRTFD